MGSYPLPALQIRAPQQENPLDMYARIAAIKGMFGQQQLQAAQLQGVQMQNQQEQLAMADDAKWRSVLQDPSWDGTPDQLLKMARKQGVGPASYATVSQHMAAMGEAYAKLGTAQLGVQDALGNHIGDQLETVLSAPDEKKLAAQAQAKQNIATWANTTPGLHPAIRQQVLQTLQQVPDDQYIGDDGVQQLINQNKMHSALVEEGLKKAQTQEAIGKGQQATAEATKANRETPQYLIDLASQKAAAEAKARQPFELQLAAANRASAQQTQLGTQGTEKINNLWADPQHGYSQFISQANATKAAIGQAQNGSQLAASMEPLMVALGVTSFAGVHRINQTEVNSAGPQVGSILRRVNAFFDKTTTGSIPPASLQEANGLVDSLIDAKHSAAVRSSGLTAANAGLNPARLTVFDRDGNLTTLDKAGAAGGGPRAGSVSVTAPDGSVHTFPDQASANRFKQLAHIQ